MLYSWLQIHNKPITVIQDYGIQFRDVNDADIKRRHQCHHMPTKISTNPCKTGLYLALELLIGSVDTTKVN